MSGVVVEFAGAEGISFERRGRAGIVTLDRPAALNALTHDMVRSLHRALDAWREDDAISVVLIRGEGRAFCAGGDIVAIHEAALGGNPPLDFFADEYRLDHKIASYPKPYVALIDGIAMGGGVGISYHGSHRIVTENAEFSMPEVGIGFFPDVGASYILSRLPGGFGMYLALTGARIGRGDQMWSGLATHAVDAASLPALIDAIAETGKPDAVLSDFLVATERELDEAGIHAVNKHFTLDNIAEIVASLQRDAALDEFCASALRVLHVKSPTSLAVTCEQVEAGGALELADCLRMEYRILVRMLERADFYEGVRAAVIDKDRKPKWQPASVAEVLIADVDAHFAPLPGRELEL